MAAKPWGTQQRAVEELFFQNDAVSLCLLISRRAKTMRVVDFRAGASNAKRTFILALAERNSVEKVCTLVERDEVSTWVKLGFDKEGNIPGFYKRSDAFMLGYSLYSQKRQSETRIALRGRAARNDAGDGDDGHDSHERTVLQGKKLVKELQARPLPLAKLAALDEVDVRKPLAAAARSGRALTAFEPFGRDVERQYFAVSTRGGFEIIISIETQSCFGNVLLEPLTSPRNDAERAGTAAGLHALCEMLLAQGAVSCFAFAPSDDVGLATAFLFNGFRKTGLLQDHVVVGGERRDAIVWSRKLANPADE